MLVEEGRPAHRFSDLLEQFPKDVSLDKFLFQDESLLWAQHLPLKFRFQSLGVLICLFTAGVFTLLDIIILSVDHKSPLAFIVACLPLPLIVLPLNYAIHRLRGSQVQVVTNYRIMQCTVRYRSFFIRSLSYNCISGLSAQGTTIEFAVKEDDETRKKSSELRSMIFRGVDGVAQVEQIVQRQLNSSLSEFQYPPNIETEQVRTDVLPASYSSLLSEIGAEPSSVLWISRPSFFDAYRSIIINTILIFLWVFSVLFSPELVNAHIVDHYVPLVVIVIVVVVAIMIIFNFLRRVDVLTARGIALFYTRFKILGIEPKVELLDYKDAFPHAIEISTVDGSGTIFFENIPPRGLAMIRWPDVLAREELIFRKHCLAHSAADKSNY